jgi:hypothetical protein
VLLSLMPGGRPCVSSDQEADRPHQENAAGMNTQPLILLARTEATSFGVGAPIPVAVTLRNVSSDPIWVNARLGAGYEDGMFRELYFTVIDASTGATLPVPETARVDAHRLPPTRDDFRELAAGEEVTTSVDLAFWYPFQTPGAYRIVFTYENDDDGQAFGLDAFTGATSAEPLEITII